METGPIRRARMARRMSRGEVTPVGRKILDVFITAAKRAGRYPSRADMTGMGVKFSRIRDQFGNMDSLIDVAKSESPDLVEHILIEKVESGSATKKVISGFKRFVITTAVDGAPVHSKALQSVLGYCAKNSAKLLIMPSGGLENVDPLLADQTWVLEDTHLNPNFRLSTIKIPPKSAIPTTGIRRIGQRGGSMAVASPKQFLEFVAVGPEKDPHAVMSTGAITESSYSSKKGKSRTDYIANYDHVMGAIIVEIESDRFYHFRQIQFDSQGVFYDLGRRYDGSKVTKESPVGMLWGDLHAGEVDEHAKRANIEIVRATGVKTVFIGDGFSGISINHHEKDNHLLRATLAGQNKLSLEEEFKELAREIDSITSISTVDTVVMIASNHCEFLTKHYLPKGWYVQEPQNYAISHKLVGAMLEGKNPIQFACENIIGLKHPNKVRWLKRDEDYCIGGVQMGAHGDKGANGSRGSKRTIEDAYGQAMHGHTHSPYIYRGIFCVGTTSVLRPGFNEGPSGWVHSSGQLYKNGSRQIINSFKGRWRLRK